MLVEMYLGGVALAGLSHLTFNYRKQNKIEAYVRNIFEQIIDFNKREEVNSSFKLDKVEVKDYGLNMDIKCLGGDLNIFRSYVKRLEYEFEGRILVTNTSSSINAKVWLNGLKIGLEDKIRFEFDKVFNGILNNDGETFRIDRIEAITRDVGNVGYNLYVSIPGGLSYDLLVDNLGNLEPLGRVFSKWNPTSKQAEIELITEQLEKVDYAPIRLRPWEFYMGLKTNYEPIILDYSVNANTLIVGKQNTGKTRVLMQGILNVLYHNSNVKLAIATTEKEDLRIFKNTQQCNWYANNLKETNSLLDILMKEMKVRNEKINSKDMCFNIYDYNKAANKKMKFIHFINDEISDFMAIDEGEIDYKIKKDITEKLIQLGRKGRSVGIYLTLATQRTDAKSLDPRLKFYLCNKIIFNQTNEKSAELILGENCPGKVRLATTLDTINREFLYDNQDGFGLGKACNLDNKILDKYIKPLIIKDKVLPKLIQEEKVIEIKSKKSNLGRYSRFKEA